MKLQVQGREVLGREIPMSVSRWLGLPEQEEPALRRLTAAEQLRQARLEGIRYATAETRAWLWLAASAAGALALSLWG